MAFFLIQSDINDPDTNTHFTERDSLGLTDGVLKNDVHPEPLSSRSFR